MSEPIVFWRDGFDDGQSGHFIRAVSINKVIPQWISEGIQVAGIVIDPENENNVDILVVRKENTT